MTPAKPSSPAKPNAAGPFSATAASLTPPTVSSEDLLRGGRELLIRHRDECYRLRLTGNDKLILVK